MKERGAKGSTTIFLSVSFMLVAAFLFTLIEASRVVEVHKVSYMTSDIIMESVFSSYNLPAWENYQLLLLEGEDRDGRLEFANAKSISEEISDEIINSGLNDMVSIGLENIDIDSYQIITDDNGQVYQEAVCSYMKENIAYEILQAIMSKYKQVNELKESEEYGMADSSIEDAQSILQPMNQNIKKATGENNPLDFASSLKKKGVLSLVVKDEGAISTKKVEKDSLVSERNCIEGNWEETFEANLVSDILLRAYVTSVFSDFTNTSDSHPLEYELEYLICGKTRDIDNLQCVVIELLAIREAANLIYLFTDSIKVAQALSLATILAGVSANPAIIEAVKIGILAAWAFIESILDVRNLLQGGCVPLLKSADSWKCELLEMPTALLDWSIDSDKSGFNYKDYLTALLFFNASEKISYRSMDIQELAIQQEQGMENFRMDHAIVRARARMNYRYKSIFHGIGNDLFQKKMKFNIEKTAEFSYI